MTSKPIKQIAYLPLDERPVNIRLPYDISAIANARLVLPPTSLLPKLRCSGSADKIATWLEAVAGEVDALVVSADMLAYGGLIPSRISYDDLGEALRRINVLTSIKAQYPEIPIFVVSIVMRATDSYDATEEPAYWTECGREFHRLGSLHHKTFLQHLGAMVTSNVKQERNTLRKSLQRSKELDFQVRRLRNHNINLHLLSLAATGVVDGLFITADDTAEYAAGTVEQIWLNYWFDVLSPDAPVLMYPGADEVGAILVARSLNVAGYPSKIALDCVDQTALQNIPKFENRAVIESIRGQIIASGAILTDDITAPLLVVHPPEQEQRCFIHDRIEFDAVAHQAAEATAQLVIRHIANGRRVALADVRYGNGSDPILIEKLAEAGVLSRLLAYGGWNTAGNTIGSVVAAANVAQQSNSNPAAAIRLLYHRIIEDYAYQSMVRPELDMKLRAGFNDRTYQHAKHEEEIRSEVLANLQRVVDNLKLSGAPVITSLSFPWHRSFEIDFNFQLQT